MNNEFRQILELQNSQKYADIVSYSAVTAISNIYTLDLQSKPLKNFSITTSDSVAKTITFANTPITAGLKVFVETFLDYTNAAALTYPTVIWKDGVVPILTAGKKYKLYFETYNGGTTWFASIAGSW